VVTDLSAVEVAHIVKAIMVARLASDCDDRAAALTWYQQNTDVWDVEKIGTHGPPGDIQQAGAAIALEGSPPGERARECWGVDISADCEVLAAIPGWYLESEACYLIYPKRLPSIDEVAGMSVK
jgi:hypothetical protein